MELQEFVSDFAEALTRVDATRPQALSGRSGAPYLPGIGPHTEPLTISMVVNDLRKLRPAPAYIAKTHLQIPYDKSRQTCDICIGDAPVWEWAIEVKMIRMLGDNGKPNDNMPSKILSPYPTQNSALTDCTKLVDSTLQGRKAIVVYGYDYPRFPLGPLVEAFEQLAFHRVWIGDRVEAPFEGLIHPVHTHGVVYGWEIAHQKR